MRLQFEEIIDEMPESKRKDKIEAFAKAWKRGFVPGKEITHRWVSDRYYGPRPIYPHEISIILRYKTHEGWMKAEPRIKAVFDRYDTKKAAMVADTGLDK